MTRSETCLKAAVRAAAGIAIVVLGQAGGSIAASLIPIPALGPLVYLVAVGPTLVIGLYLVATGAWIVVEGATGQAMEGGTSSPFGGVPSRGAPDEPDDADAAPGGSDDR